MCAFTTLSARTAAAAAAGDRLARTVHPLLLGERRRVPDIHSLGCVWLRRHIVHRCHTISAPSVVALTLPRPNASPAFRTRPMAKPICNVIRTAVQIFHTDDQELWRDGRRGPWDCAQGAEYRLLVCNFPEAFQLGVCCSGAALLRRAF